MAKEMGGGSGFGWSATPAFIYIYCYPSLFSKKGNVLPPDNDSDRNNDRKRIGIVIVIVIPTGGVPGKNSFKKLLFPKKKFPKILNLLYNVSKGI